MQVLIVFATTEGQTRKVAMFMAERLRAMGHRVRLIPAEEAVTSLDLEASEAVIVAASVHVGRYQSSVVRFVKEQRHALETRASAFVSVSMTAANDDHDDRKALKRYVARFCRQTQWQPGRVHHVGGAICYTQYDFLRRWAMLLFALRRGASTDCTRDHEFTDWNDVNRFIEAFATWSGSGDDEQSCETRSARSNIRDER